MKRITSLLIVLALLTTAFISCSGGKGSNTADTTTAAAAEVTETEVTETTELTAYDYLEKADYEGYKFRIIGPTGQTRYLPTTVVPEELTGEIIYDAAFDRNKAVEDYFNVEIVYVDGVGTSAALTQTRSNIQAGEDAFDLVINSLVNSGTAASEKLFLDVLTIDNIDVTTPWYNQSVNDNLTLGGKLMTFASDFTCIFLSCTYCIFVNQTMAYEKFTLPNMHDMVLDGSWTHDRLADFCKSVAKDLNGDGVMSSEDQYGFGFSGTLAPNNETSIMQQYGMEQFTTVPDKDGLPQLVVNSERMAKVVEKLYTLYTAPDTLSKPPAWNDAIKMFANNQLLFLNCIIMHAPNYMRDMEDNYGVLPMPKLDEAQTNYYTSISPGSGMFEAIPITVKDIDRSSAIFEALAYEGHITIIPAFFETSMKVKYSRDEATTKMFDLLREGTVVDFGLVFDGGVGMSTIIAHTLSGGGTGFASRYASIEAKALEKYQAVIDAFTA